MTALGSSTLNEIVIKGMKDEDIESLMVFLTQMDFGNKDELLAKYPVKIKLHECTYCKRLVGGIHYCHRQYPPSSNGE